MSLITIDSLTVKAGNKVLVADVSLVIEPGTWCTIIGPNGAGRRPSSRRSRGCDGPRADPCRFRARTEHDERA